MRSLWSKDKVCEKNGLGLRSLGLDWDWDRLKRTRAGGIKLSGNKQMSMCPLKHIPFQILEWNLRSPSLTIPLLSINTCETYTDGQVTHSLLATVLLKGDLLLLITFLHQVTESLYGRSDFDDGSYPY